MPTTYRFKLHENGPALWPEHKSLAEVLDLQASTPASIFSSTYQGEPTPPGGVVFLKEWWEAGRNRFDATDRGLVNQVIGRWISFDTASKDKEENAYTAWAVGELMPDYRLNLREVGRDKVTFPDLPPLMTRVCRPYASDNRLRGVLIEDRSTGTSAYQTLAQSEEEWLRRALIPFLPTTGKEERAEQGAVWCKLDSVLLPHPSAAVPWLYEAEQELFTFPGSVFKDQVDAISQLLIFLEHLLSTGWRARNGMD